MPFHRRFLLIARCFVTVMTGAFALWLGLNLLFPPHRLNWPTALDQALSTSAVILAGDFLQNRVRGWLQSAPKWLLVPVRLPSKAAPEPKRMKEALWTPDTERVSEPRSSGYF